MATMWQTNCFGAMTLMLTMPVRLTQQTTWRMKRGRTKLVLLTGAAAWRRVEPVAARQPLGHPQQRGQQIRAFLANMAVGTFVAACMGRTTPTCSGAQGTVSTRMHTATRWRQSLQLAKATLPRWK